MPTFCHYLRWINKYFLWTLWSALVLIFEPTKTWNLLMFWRKSEHSSVMKHSQEPRCMTGLSHLKKTEQRLKICEDYAFRRKVFVIFFKSFLFINFLTKQQTINAYFYSKLLKTRVKPAFRSKRRGRLSQKRLSPPRKSASARRRCDNRNIQENSLRDDTPWL
jgi:hypothetical protein